MSDELLIAFCSPTLAGIKTGSLFSVPFAHIHDMRNAVRQINLRLGGKGICMLPVKYENGKALLYVYRPKFLSRDLKNEDALQLLRERGYHDLSPNQCILRLMEKFRTDSAFPHEIGLFLSYPPEDVRGFIENRAANFKMTGTWKVYGDMEKARKTFQRYSACTKIYNELWLSGKTVEQLTVTV